MLALLVLAAPVLAGPAVNYRGPHHESARGISAPGEEGLIGTDRLHSKTNRVEGDARWEFWWEHNRDDFLRRALLMNERLRSGDGGDVFYSAEPQRDRHVSLKSGKDRIGPLLIDRLGSSDPEERRVAAIALGLAGETGAFSGLRAMLARSSSSDRKAAALGLGLLGDALAFADLSALLARSGAPVGDRAAAALGLGFLGGREAVGALEAALSGSLRHRGKGAEELQGAIATALGLAGGEDQVSQLVRLARQRENRSVLVRSAALNSLGRLGGGAAIPTLLKLLKDPSPTIRAEAARALGMMHAVDALPALKATLSQDGDASVRSEAVMALARIGGSGVAEALVASLDQRNPRVLREFAAIALGILGEQKSAGQLMSLLDGRQGEGLAGAAAIALGIMRYPGAAPALRSLSDSGKRDHAVRGYAVVALAMLGDSVTRDKIASLARKPGATHLRRAASLSLGLFPRMNGSRAVLGSLLEESDPTVRGAAINSLALVPRGGAADMLLGMVQSRGFTEDARLDALTALGVLLRRGQPSRLSVLTRDLNYRATVPAVEELTVLF